MKKPTRRALLVTARAQTKTQPDGSVDEEDLLDTLVTLIELEEADKRRIAKEIVDSETKPGSTDRVGQLRLPGLENYDYEPCRLVRDDERHLLEQHKTSTKYKFAESSRASKHLHEASEWAERKRTEAELFATWVIKHQSNGRHERLTFGDFIEEADLWQRDTPESK